MTVMGGLEATTDEVLVKGVTFRSILAAAGELRGPAFVERVRASVPGKAGDAIRFGGVISSGWYPIGWFRSLYGTVVDLAGDRDFAREVGRASTRLDAGNVLRLVFRVFTIPMLLGQAGRIFKMYYQGCDMALDNVAPGHVIVRWSRCRGFDRNVWLDQLGTAEELFALHGGRNLEIAVIAGGSDGDSTMSIEGKWR